MKKKIILLLVVLMIGLVIAGAVFAGVFCMLFAPKKKQVPDMQSFENYYNFTKNEWQTVVDDPDWTKETEAVVTAALKRTSGPIMCEVEVFCREPSALSWFSCGTAVMEVGGTGKSFVIPENNVFKVMARAAEGGKSGHATIQVTFE